MYIKELKEGPSVRKSQETQKIVSDGVSTNFEQSGNIETIQQARPNHRGNRMKTIIAARNIQTAPEQKLVFISPDSGQTSENI